MQDNIEGVVHRGSFTLDSQVGADGLGLAEEHHGLIGQVRSEIEQHTTAGFGALTPGVFFELWAEAVEVRLKQDDAPQFVLSKQALEGEKVAVPAAILIDGQQSLFLICEIDKFRSFGIRGCERLVDDYIAASKQTLLGQIEVRGVGSCNHDQADGFDRE